MLRFLKILAVCLLAGCDLNFGGDYTLNALSFTDEHLKTIERVSHLTLPEGTRGLNMFYQGSGIDDALIAKLEIPEEKVLTIMNEIEMIKGTEGVASESIAVGHDWWSENMMNIKLHRKLNVRSDYLEMILGQEEDNWILLLKWVST